MFTHCATPAKQVFNALADRINGRPVSFKQQGIILLCQIPPQSSKAVM